MNAEGQGAFWVFHNGIFVIRRGNSIFSYKKNKKVGEHNNYHRPLVILNDI